MFYYALEIKRWFKSFLIFCPVYTVFMIVVGGVASALGYYITDYLIMIAYAYIIANIILYLAMLYLMFRGTCISRFSIKYPFIKAYELHLNNLAKGERKVYLELLKKAFVSAFDRDSSIIDLADTQIELALLDGFPDKTRIEATGKLRYTHIKGISRFRCKSRKEKQAFIKGFTRPVYYYKIPPTQANREYINKHGLVENILLKYPSKSNKQLGRSESN